MEHILASENIREFNDENFENEIKKGVTLVDFHADWCGPCRMLSPVLEKVAVELKGKTQFGKVDIDESQKIASLFQVTSVPTLVLFKDGREVGRLIGLRDAETIKEFISAGK